MTISQLVKLSNTKLFFLCFFLIILLEIPITYVIGFIDQDAFIGLQFGDTPLDIIVEFMLTIVVAPFLETIIFQVIIIEVLIWLRVKSWIAIGVSALLFSFAHYYSLYYILAIFPSGLLLILLLHFKNARRCVACSIVGDTLTRTHQHMRIFKYASFLTYYELNFEQN